MSKDGGVLYAGPYDKNDYSCFYTTPVVNRGYTAFSIGVDTPSTRSALIVAEKVRKKLLKKDWAIGKDEDIQKIRDSIINKNKDQKD